MNLRIERLENRIALSHAVPDHIHAKLTISLEGEVVSIPANIGLGDGHYNPHTHSSDGADSGGIIHIGEGGPAGISGQYRYVRLSDFFDVWREAGGAAGNNVDAVFSENEIMGLEVDRHHELTMLVNGRLSTDFQNYIPHDNDTIVVNYSRTSWNWQNENDPLDVSGDGEIVPRDALLVINDLISEGAHEVDSKVEPSAFLDTSGDDFISPLDALLVINYLIESS